MTTPDQPPLQAMNPTGRFADRASDYSRFRPSYPALAIDAILDGLGEPDALVAADVGAGTGISARLLADRGVRVYGIEPNAEMRSQAREHPRVEMREGLAERTGLSNGSVDLVLCAQSYHWFKPEASLREFRRVLKRGRRLALMWNDKDNSDELTRGYSEAVARASVDSGACERRTAPVSIVESGLFVRPRELRFSHAQRVSAEGLIGRAMSASYVAKTGTVAQELVRELRALHERHHGGDGLVELKYVTRVTLAERD